MSEQEPKIYRNVFGKERIILDPENSFQESQKRREYFYSIQPVLMQDFAEYISPIRELFIIGSVAENAAESYSDIDVLLNFSHRFNLDEIKNISEISNMYIEELNQSTEYKISLYYRRPTPRYPSLMRLRLTSVIDPDIEPLNPNLGAL